MDGSQHPITFRRVSGGIGAEVQGLDIQAGVSDETIAHLRRAWLEHEVLFFRDQELGIQQFFDFASRFGEVDEYPFVTGLPENPKVIPILKLAHEKKNFGGVWHADTAYLQRPPMATMLIARELPPYGGDTLFASGTRAYDALSDGMKQLLDGLHAVNTSAKADVTGTREDRLRDSRRSDAREVYEAEHPVVRTHPKTGKKTLFVSTAHTSRFAGMTEAESAPLLNYLFEHQVRPEFTCRFSWRPGSIAFWDNRCTLHNPVNDYHGHKRLLHRVTLKGEKPA